MFEIQERIEVRTPRATIWATLIDVGNWSTWDNDVAESALQTPFQDGSGYLVDIGGKRSTFHVTAIDEGWAYSNCYDLGANNRIDFTHRIYRDEVPYLVVFQAKFSGPLAVYRFVKTQRALRATMKTALLHLSQLFDEALSPTPFSA